MKRKQCLYLDEYTLENGRKWQFDCGPVTKCFECERVQYFQVSFGTMFEKVGLSWLRRRTYSLHSLCWSQKEHHCLSIEVAEKWQRVGQQVGLMWMDNESQTSKYKVTATASLMYGYWIVLEKDWKLDRQRLPSIYQCRFRTWWSDFRTKWL